MTKTVKMNTLSPAQRKRAMRYSNNKANPAKNNCALAVATKLGAECATDYLHTLGDLLEATKAVGWRLRPLGTKRTVGAAREQLANYADEHGVRYYIVRTPQHVLLLDRRGKTIVDTDSRIRDRRRAMNVIAIM